MDIDDVESCFFVVFVVSVLLHNCRNRMFIMQILIYKISLLQNECCYKSRKSTPASNTFSIFLFFNE